MVIGLLGTQLDGGFAKARWERWRPTVDICLQPGPAPARVELLYPPSNLRLAERVADDIREVSSTTDVRLSPLAVRDPWDFGEMYAALYDWTSGYSFAPDRQKYQVHITTGTHVAQICLFLLVETRQIPGVLLQSSPGPKDAVHKSSDPPVAHGKVTLIDLDLSRYDALARRFEKARSDALTHLKGGIATRNAAFNELIREIERVAVGSRAPMLLTGPTGAGKSHLARRIFELKRARHLAGDAFVDVNCATLKGDAAGSALFGHRKGAFTGAAADRPGLLRSADGGVLFLDEIGELGLDEQAMLLKAIEERRFYPLGSDREVRSDFQLIAGTNRDLRLDVQRGVFRADLFARINLWSYELPGLAQRPEDIEPNVDHLLVTMSAELGRALRFHPEAKAAYLEFAQSEEAPWHGNFRDLSASMTRMATLAEAGRIDLAQVRIEIERLRWLWARGAATGASDASDASNESKLNVPGASAAQDARDVLDAIPDLDRFDRLQLEAVVAVCRDSATLSEAGRRLFDRSRARRSVINDADRLRKYLARFGLDWNSVRSG